MSIHKKNNYLFILKKQENVKFVRKDIISFAFLLDYEW